MAEDGWKFNKGVWIQTAPNMCAEGGNWKLIKGEWVWKVTKGKKAPKLCPTSRVTCHFCDFLIEACHFYKRYDLISGIKSIRAYPQYVQMEEAEGIAQCLSETIDEYNRKHEHRGCIPVTKKCEDKCCQECTRGCCN